MSGLKTDRIEPILTAIVPAWGGFTYKSACKKIKKYGFLQDIAYEYKHVMHYVQNYVFLIKICLYGHRKKRDTKSPHRERSKAIMYL